jgi:hypothetical protein
MSVSLRWAGTTQAAVFLMTSDAYPHQKGIMDDDDDDDDGSRSEVGWIHSDVCVVAWP